MQALNSDFSMSPLEERINYANKHLSHFNSFHENIPKWPHTPITNNTNIRDFLHYSSSLGLDALRKLISERETKKYGISCKPENILITAGGLHAIHLILNYCKANSYINALCQTPIYINIYKEFQSQGYQISNLQLDTLTDETLSEQLKNIEPKSRCLYINSPSNPFGNIIPSTCIEKIVRYTEKHNSYLITDMVYDDFIFDNINTPCNPLQYSSDWDNIFVINSMSKNYGAPGLRLGWIVSSEQNILKISSILEKSMICIASHSQNQAIELIKYGNADLVTNCFESMHLIKNNEKKYPHLTLNSPVAGVQLVATLPEQFDVQKFADHMLYEYKILIATSADNYIGSSSPFIRIPCNKDNNDVISFLTLLDHGLNEWQQ